jgi:hypothetical protein
MVISLAAAKAFLIDAVERPPLFGGLSLIAFVFKHPLSSIYTVSVVSLAAIPKVL